MIADAVYFAIAGIGFCYAAGRSIIHAGFRAGMNTLVPQNWIRRRGRSRKRNLSGFDQEFLKEAEYFRFDHTSLNTCRGQDLCRSCPDLLKPELLAPPVVDVS